MEAELLIDQVDVAHVDLGYDGNVAEFYLDSEGVMEVLQKWAALSPSRRSWVALGTVAERNTFHTFEATGATNASPKLRSSYLTGDFHRSGEHAYRLESLRKVLEQDAGWMTPVEAEPAEEREGAADAGTLIIPPHMVLSAPGVEVGAHSSDEGSPLPEATVVQIDTNEEAKRVRVYLNEAILFDGVPGKDDALTVENLLPHLYRLEKMGQDARHLCADLNTARAKLASALDVARVKS